MKEILNNIIRERADLIHRRSIAREYLQSRVLLALQNQGAFTDWAFLGGTALRFLFQLPRYSEDLDFSLSEPGRDSRFEKLMRGVKRELESEAYDVDIKLHNRRVVASAWIKFQHVLYDIGISPHADEVLAIKIEIDTNPPAGAGVTTRVIRRFSMLNLLHYDKSSLFAGKLHAVLSRKYTKGRDLYDLIWYLSDPTWPEPNLVQLNNALLQSEWKGTILTKENWQQVILDHTAGINWEQAKKDVVPFLERERDINMVSFKLLKSLIPKTVI
jgi:predicted nucleotidyltransferase component of viral defense system